MLHLSKIEFGQNIIFRKLQPLLAISVYRAKRGLVLLISCSTCLFEFKSLIRLRKARNINVDPERTISQYIRCQFFIAVVLELP